ncbi:MAG: hypothetical protein AAFZ80_00010 [Cyanobacteria bacterium P01_A01_bin.105]
MTPEDQSPMLDLLVPWEIPLECRLSDAEKQPLRESLQRLLAALEEEDFTRSQSQIEQILTNLPSPAVQPAQIASTKTSLTADAVDDYDRYFSVSHVRPKTATAYDIALCLVRGLLINCQRFTALCCQMPQPNLQHVAQQQQGFISYAHLLARTFSLENLS